MSSSTAQESVLRAVSDWMPCGWVGYLSALLVLGVLGVYAAVRADGRERDVSR